ncbi:DUF4249 domain-containing protein [Algoriphagus hitonicola]|uniref:DUF4249 domain-containing protein n=1 Tax=Algoriphagus hitonicola TaxID=435880 RepID=A0A1I2UQ13_9BACT|nr:DUF4249 domain-containing protein [Algoriphagus hitonicola]SFG79255.1 protein of unknown function [Algoriphagus hitonicola]
MNKKYWVLWVVGFLCIPFACVEQISFPLDRQEEKLIVFGQISNLQEEKYIFLSSTTSQDRQPLSSGDYLVLNDLPRPVTNAQVSLVGSDNSTFLFTHQSDGRYDLSRNVPILDGVSYFVEIQVNGKTYRSSPEEIPEAVGSDELSYDFGRGELDGIPGLALISIYSDVELPETSEPYYLRWEVEEAYFWQLTFFPNPFNQGPPPCYVFEFPDSERIPLLSGESLRGGVEGGRQLLATRQVDQSFLSRHYFTVRQISMSKSAFDYWRNVRDLVNNTGSVFDTPPAPIQGNIVNVNDPDEVVLGYVEVAKVAQKRIYTTLADVPFELEEVCTYQPGKPAIEYPQTCRNCNAFRNSSTQTPEWWFDQ